MNAVSHTIPPVLFLIFRACLTSTKAPCLHLYCTRSELAISKKTLAASPFVRACGLNFILSSIFGEICFRNSSPTDLQSCLLSRQSKAPDMQSFTRKSEQIRSTRSNISTLPPNKKSFALASSPIARPKMVHKVCSQLF
jgi:hypothetical protein